MKKNREDVGSSGSGKGRTRSEAATPITAITSIFSELKLNESKGYDLNKLNLAVIMLHQLTSLNKKLMLKPLNGRGYTCNETEAPETLHYKDEAYSDHNDFLDESKSKLEMFEIEKVRPKVLILELNYGFPGKEEPFVDLIDYAINVIKPGHLLLRSSSESCIKSARNIYAIRDGSADNVIICDQNQLVTEIKKLPNLSGKEAGSPQQIRKYSGF